MHGSWAYLYSDVHILAQKRRWTSYHACRVDTKEKVSLKRICFSTLSTRESNTLAQAYSQLESLSSSYIVKCSVTHYSPGDCLLLESPLEEGHNLIDHVKHTQVPCRPVSEDVLWPILFQISMGLAYLHTPVGKGIILHRNLTPTNVIVMERGAIKLSDIWLGPFFSDDDTAAFQAPELRACGSFSSKVDIYSLGCIAATLCMDCNLDTDTVMRFMLESRGYTSALITLLLACLDPDPSRRPAAWDVAEQSAVISELRSTKLRSQMATIKIEEVAAVPPVKHANSKTSLMLAAERGSLVGVKALLYEAGTVWSGPRELPGTDVITATAASLSLFHGHSECFKVLAKLEVGLAGVTPPMLYAAGTVELPSDPAALEAVVAMHCTAKCMGVTALMIASLCNICALFPLLREELLLLDDYGRSALAYLRGAERDTCTALLRIAEEDNTQLHPLSRQLILNEQIDAALLYETDDLWTKDRTGWCPLLYAISFNRLHAVRCILSCEKPWPSNSILEIALNLALISRDSDSVLAELVAYLDKHDITVNARRRYGDVTLIRTELMHAAAKGNIAEVRKYIHQMGKNAAGLEGGTALICAAAGGHVECCRLLYRELGMQDKHGRTALDHAREGGHLECMRLLRHECNLSKNEGQ